MVANRHKNIRAALCLNEEMARLSREHNDANILCLGSRFIEKSEAIKCVDIFMMTEFEGERHLKRINKISVSIGPSNFNASRQIIVLARTLAQQINCSLDSFSSFELMAKRLPRKIISITIKIHFGFSKN